MLLERRPRAISKAEFLERLWPKTFVAAGSLTNVVAEIRKALGDDARSPRYVRTVYGFGYSFCASTVEEPAAKPPVASREVVFRLIWGAREIELHDGENVLGRTQDSVVWISSETVSRRHARILVSGGTATLEDLGSKNGTELHGRKIASPMPLTDGDAIRIGSVLMTLRAFPALGSTATEGR